MRLYILGAAAMAAIMVVSTGCGSGMDAEKDKTPLSKMQGDDPAKQALLPEMYKHATGSVDTWDGLSEAQRKPFKDYYDGDEEKAKNHFVTLRTNVMGND
jgi:hypothetical protein